jgi:hypothetical protein
MTRGNLKRRVLNWAASVALPPIRRRHLDALAHPRAEQERLFRSFRRQLAGTSLAKDVRLDRYGSFGEFLRNFPAMPYDFYAPYVQRAMGGERRAMYRDATDSFLVTSGTSGYNNKIIPCNDALLRTFVQTQRKAFAFILPGCRDMAPTSDRFAYGARSGAADAAGVPVDYVSGRVPFMIPRPLREYVFPDAPTLSELNWETKLRLMAQEAQRRDVRGIFGLPAYLLHVLREIAAVLGLSTLKEIWPNLELCVYSGTPVNSYRQSLNLLAGTELRYFGAYVATESPMGFEMPADGPGPSRMAFIPDLVLYSFHDLNGSGSVALALNELQVGGEYLVNLGTPNGIVHYAIRDWVKIVQTRPFVQFELMGRYDSVLNAAAEKVSETQIEQAVQRLQAFLNLSLADYFVFPSQDADGTPRYEWTFAVQTLHSPTTMAATIDLALMEISADYKETRFASKVLAPPVAQIVAPGRDRQRHARRLQGAGQFKPRHAFRNRAEFLAFVDPAALRVSSPP